MQISLSRFQLRLLVLVLAALALFGALRLRGAEERAVTRVVRNLERYAEKSGRGESVLRAATQLKSFEACFAPNVRVRAREIDRDQAMPREDLARTLFGWRMQADRVHARFYALQIRITGPDAAEATADLTVSGAGWGERGEETREALLRFAKLDGRWRVREVVVTPIVEK